MTWRQLLVGAGLGVALVGYLGHRDRVLLERLDAIEARAQKVTAAPVEGPRVIYREGGVDGEALAARVAARLATRAEPVLPPSSPSPENGAPAEPSAAATAALSRASSVADDVLARGHLTPRDVEELHGQLSQAESPAESSAIRRRLLMAINTNRLVVDDPRFLP